MTPAADYVRQADHEAMDREYQAWLAQGNAPEIVPVGVMAESLWTPRQRVNPTVVSKAEREAQKARAAAIRPPRAKAAPKPRPSRARTPEQRKTRVRNGPRPAQPGTLVHEALEALRQHGWMSGRQLAELKGWGMNCTMQRLIGMRKSGLVESQGPRWGMTWRTKCP